MKKRVAILISGTGSNMEALIEAAACADYPAEIALILSDKADAGGLRKAQAKNIPTHSVVRKDFSSKQAHEAAILQILAAYKIEIICLAGYMRLISEDFIALYRDHILNIHPSLLPLFPGLDTHKRALEAGVKIAGCSVHIVTKEMDAGAILGQAAVPVHEKDTESSLAQRVLKAEHQLYPTVLKKFIEGTEFVKTPLIGETSEILLSL